MKNPLPDNLVPERWLADVFIAGGYAAMPERATDIDVWVTVPTQNSLIETRRELLDHLQTEGFIFKEEGEARTHISEVWVDAYTNLTTRKVARVVGRTYTSHSDAYVRPIHLLVSNGTLYDVLESFDLSTHQVGLEQDGDEWRRVEGSNYTPPYELPHILKMTPTTPTRFEKLVLRYADLNGFRPPAQEHTNGL